MVSAGGAAPALLWKTWRGGPAVHCYLCAHHCRVEPGERGRCGVRENREGVLHTLVFGNPVAVAVDPIEKKPLFHFLPGTLSMSVAAVGCNFTCLFCQNFDISQMPRDWRRIDGSALPAERVVQGAVQARCASISYTYTEPTVFFEYAEACGLRALESGLRNVFVTNGFMTKQALERAACFVHAANVDLKGFTEEYYRRVVGGRLKPVMDSIRRMVEAGIWVEVTTLLVPGHNDSPGELRNLAAFLAGLSPDLPWHISRFHPSYRMMDVPVTPLASIERAVAIGREAGLRYVYAGNVPGHDSESTRCPSCGEVVIGRSGFTVTSRHLQDHRCGKCGEVVALVTAGEGDGRAPHGG